MKTFRVTFAVLVAVFCALAASPAGAAYEGYRTAIDLKQSVRLADGSVLPPGPYDLELRFDGKSRMAECRFFSKGKLMGKQNLEARGFPAPVGASTAKVFPKIEESTDKDVKGEVSTGKVFPKVEVVDKTTPLDAGLSKGVPAGAAPTQDFRFAASGFDGKTPARLLKVPGALRLEINSSNSPAQFVGELKLVSEVQKGIIQ